VWIWQSGRHQELELVIINDRLVTESEVIALVDLLEQDWLKSWI
jgi:hypothetical protein